MLRSRRRPHGGTGRSGAAPLAARLVRHPSCEPFRYHFSHHGDELGMYADGGTAHRVDSELSAQFGGFGIEIVDHFHMVGEEADGREDQVVALARGMQDTNTL